MGKHLSGRAALGLRAVFTIVTGVVLGFAQAATITVNSLADDVFDVAGDWSGAAGAGKCTLRMAIAAANIDSAIGGAGGCVAGNGSDSISFAATLNLATTPGTITIANVAMSTNPRLLPAGLTNPPPLFVANSLSITGPGSTQLTIDGSLAAVSGRRIIAAADFDDTALFSFALSGVRLLRGRVLDGTGGCLATSETLSLTDVVFESCEAVSGANNSGYGGALNVGVDGSIPGNTRPDVSINNSRFIGNRATHGSSTNRSEGGAAGIGGSGNWVGNVTITNTIVNGNSADTRGGMLIGNAVSVTISGSQFIANSSTGSSGVGTSGRHGGLLIVGIDGNVTISGTRFNGNVANEERAGLGINTVGGTVTLTDVDVIGNTANRGPMAGADILTDDGNCGGTSLQPVNLTNVRIQGNSAATSIGGIRIICSGAVTLTDVNISGNETRGYRLTPTDAVQSAISAGQFSASNVPQSTLTFNRVLIENNRTALGTGGLGSVVFINGLSAFTADSLLFRNNKVGGSFGIWLNGLAGVNYLIRNSEFSGNVADAGPALYFGADGNYTLRNTTITGNTARVNGTVNAYALNAAPGAFQVNIEHSTIARNTSPGAEAFSLGSSGGSNAVIAFRNSILGSRYYGYNASTVVGIDASVTVVTDHSLLESTGGAPANFCSGAGMKCNVASLVSPISNNGGTSGIGTMALLAGSPAINAGGTVSSGVTTDARGTGFPRVVGSAVDMGAFESAPATMLGCTLDVDGNGSIDALTDGLMVIRALFGLTGTAVTNGALGASPTRSDWSAIRGYINANCGTNFAP